MIKTNTLVKATIIISMVALSGIACSQVSGTTSKPDGMTKAKTEKTVQPSPTIEPTWWEQELSDANKRNDALKWHYDNKDKRLTVSGAGAISNTPITVDASPNHVDWTYIEKHVKEIVIEEGITAIVLRNFSYCQNLKKVSLPDSLQKIGSETFWRCGSLEEINIPEQVQSIGQNCFYHCKSLRKVTLGKSVEKLGKGIFADCPNLRQVEVSPENEYFMTKNGGLYQKEGKVLYLHYAKSAQVNIEEGTERIAEFAIQGNEKVRQITIPASVKTIGGGAMLYCSNLQEVKFPEQSQLKEIEMYCTAELGGDDPGENYGCFQGCKKLQKCIFPESLERIPSEIFWGTSVKRIYLGKNFKGYPENYESKFRETVSSLKKYIVSEENENFCGKDGVLYDKEMKTLLVYPPQKRNTKFTVPESVKIILSVPHEGKLIIKNKDTKLDYWILPKKNKKLTIYGKKNSKVYRMAKKRKIRFVEI